MSINTKQRKNLKEFRACSQIEKKIIEAYSTCNFWNYFFMLGDFSFSYLRFRDKISVWRQKFFGQIGLKGMCANTQLKD